ncbi:hypothetical protein HYX70_03795, partial [Candidatus Saccharibacteria bacterium]|nr:hypothetical protein [Candidatus Saccharibacteria bacterium]
MNLDKDTPANTPAQGNQPVAPANSTSQSPPAFSTTNSKNVTGDLLSSQIAKEGKLNEQDFNNQVLSVQPTTAKPHRPLKKILFGAAAILAILLIPLGIFAAYRSLKYTEAPSNLSDQFGSTTFDLNNLSPAKPTAATGLVVINGNEQVNGNLTVAGS